MTWFFFFLPTWRNRFFSSPDGKPFFAWEFRSLFFFHVGNTNFCPRGHPFLPLRRRRRRRFYCSERSFGSREFDRKGRKKKRVIFCALNSPGHRRRNGSGWGLPPLLLQLFWHTYPCSLLCPVAQNSPTIVSLPRGCLNLVIRRKIILSFRGIKVWKLFRKFRPFRVRREEGPKGNCGHH